MKRWIVKLGFIISVFMSTQALAITKIEINRGNVDPMPIAIPDFTGNNFQEKELGNNMAQVIANDLESSGLFRAIPPNAFIEYIKDGKNTVPNFASWRQVNATALSIGAIEKNGNQIEVNFRLWDVYAGAQIAGRSYNTVDSNWRRIAHMIADEIYKRLTGEDGFFDSRIVYVAESGPGTKRIKRLAVMDYDGANHKFLTSGKNLVLTPRFSPAAHHILYMSYARKIPKVFIRDLETGRERLLGDFPGMSFAPRFSPDGKSVIMSIARNGNTQIHTLELATSQMKKLTEGNAINTSPCYTPDGQQIVFNSDRSGKPQLYIMSAWGGEAKRISFGNGRYATPVVSPRGDLVAFTKWGDGSGQFSIGVMRLDGSGERILARGYLVEGPTWSPNGRVIMYAKQESPSGRQIAPAKIYAIDLTGYNEREIPTPAEGSDPAWSNLLSLN
ncbi:MAG: Tol-Pal system protein TolB [Sphingobacteriia bacterium]|nr:Tol-Pal system protein TolB [Sphingobacteriia bacterium]